jgi:hypothetical protein
MLEQPIRQKGGGMRKSLGAIIVFAGILLVAGVANADSNQLTTFYDDYLTKKIDNCERIASIDKHSSSSMVNLVKMRALQAKFYKRYRQELVRDMVASNLGTEPHKIDYFLITKFQESS